MLGSWHKSTSHMYNPVSVWVCTVHAYRYRWQVALICLWFYSSHLDLLRSLSSRNSLHWECWVPEEGLHLPHPMETKIQRLSSRRLCSAPEFGSEEGGLWRWREAVVAHFHVHSCRRVPSAAAWVALRAVCSSAIGTLVLALPQLPPSSLSASQVLRLCWLTSATWYMCHLVSNWR